LTQLASLRQGVAEPDSLLLVAADRQGTVVGFALSFLGRRPDPLLESLHVVGDVQGRGVGTLLMRATAAEMKARGHRSMHLQVIAGNARAERFYDRLGGIVVGLEPASWAPGVRHHVYRWPNLDDLA
jgi:GNAT superfamily N-acetyltransferase